jgi:hypothetical protein
MFFHDPIVIVDRDHIKEVYTARDDELSNLAALQDILQQDYILHPEVARIRYQLKVIKSMMTRQIPNAMPDVLDEMQAAFDDEMVVTEGELPNSFFGAHVRLDTLYSISESTKNNRKDQQPYVCWLTPVYSPFRWY